MHDPITFLVATSPVGPLQSEVMDRLDAAWAPRHVVQDNMASVSSATPVLIERATGDPWWALGTFLGVSKGNMSAVMALREATAGCEAALRVARLFLHGGGVPA